jgi:hypothetical protein
MKRDDVDDVIGIASELEQSDADRVSVPDLEEVGRRLDIEPRYVREAVGELDRRKRAKAEARTVALAASAVISVALAAELPVSHGSLSSSLAAVEQARAQVENVRDRRESSVRRAETTG